MRHINFLSIGDTTIDNFIQIKDAHVNCNLKSEDCELCFKFGQKIPYEKSIEVPAVGNSANAAVCASRLGLKTALVSAVGNDMNGINCLRVFRKENISRKYITIDRKGNPTNYHFILSYNGERTILTNHSPFEYSLHKNAKVDWVYLSSIGEHSESFYQEILI